MQLENFLGNNIHIETKDGKLWFALEEACNILDIFDIEEAEKELNKTDIQAMNVWFEPNMRFNKTEFVNEFGLAKLIQESRSPLSIPFGKWACEMVEQTI